LSSVHHSADADDVHYNPGSPADSNEKHNLNGDDRDGGGHSDHSDDPHSFPRPVAVVSAKNVPNPGHQEMQDQSQEEQACMNLVNNELVLDKPNLVDDQQKQKMSGHPNLNSAEEDVGSNVDLQETSPDKVFRKIRFVCTGTASQKRWSIFEQQTATGTTENEMLGSPPGNDDMPALKEMTTSAEHSLLPSVIVVDLSDSEDEPMSIAASESSDEEYKPLSSRRCRSGVKRRRENYRPITAAGAEGRLINAQQLPGIGTVFTVADGCVAIQ
jgi:hypothetical protein